MRIIFMGTPEFAVPALIALADAGHEVIAAYTQPPRPGGRRGKELTPSPVHREAEARGIPVRHPASLKGTEEQAGFAALGADIAVVAAYGLILPQAVLDAPRHGCLNLHGSLLPRWRGAAPIQRAILAGDAETGVCLMQMDAGLDTGPVLLERRTAITSDDTGGSLHDRLAALGAEVLQEGLARASRGESLPATPQSETGATYARKLDKAEAKLDFTQPAAKLERKVRAFDSWPVAEAELAGERVRVWRAVALPSPESRVPSPGQILTASKAGIDIACGSGALRILKLQRAGGRAIDAADYVNARAGLRTA